jgi:hypothetical protein
MLGTGDGAAGDLRPQSLVDPPAAGVRVGHRLRHLIVYPPLMREIGREWREPTPSSPPMAPPLLLLI